MKYAFFGACGAVALVSTMTLSAQTPAQRPATRPQPPAPTQPSTNAADQSPITVTGCLKPWDSTMGTSPADPMAKPGATPMAATRYVLSNVFYDKATEGPPQSATPTAGTPPPAQPHASQYIVVAGSGVNLNAHVNHQVRLVGSVDHGMARGSMAPPERPTGTPAEKPMTRPGDPAPAPGMATSMPGHQQRATLTAMSVTMISATCTSTVQQ